MLLPEVVRLARELMNRHGLGDWQFGFNDRKRTLGICWCNRKTIELGAYYATHNPEPEIKDTILHEIAHGLVGWRYGHGPVWRVKAREVGATPKACAQSADIIVPEGDWQTTCPGCQQTLHKYRRPKRLKGWNCRKCGPVRGALPPWTHKTMIPQKKVVVAPAIRNYLAVCGGCTKVFDKPFLPPKGVFCQTCGPVKGLLTFTEKT